MHAMWLKSILVIGLETQTSMLTEETLGRTQKQLRSPPFNLSGNTLGALASLTEFFKFVSGQLWAMDWTEHQHLTCSMPLHTKLNWGTKTKYQEPHEPIFLRDHRWQSWITYTLRGVVHPTMKMLALIIYPHVISNFLLLKKSVATKLFCYQQSLKYLLK